MGPIKIGFINYKKNEKISNKLLIGIDQGCTLTKIIFLNKANLSQVLDQGQIFVTFQWSVFINEDFEEALQFIKDNAYIPKDCDYSIHITGVGAFTQRKILERKFGLKVQLISEGLSIMAGLVIALSEFGADSFTSLIIKSQIKSGVNEEPLTKFSERKDSLISEGNINSPFPCLILNIGSSSSFLFINEEGRCDFLSVLLLGGKTLLGLAKCLLNINNYSELMNLANHGSRFNVNNELKEVMGNSTIFDQNSFNDFYISFFGKLEDLNINLEDIRREDLARSLVSLFCSYLLSTCVQMAKVKNLSKVYLNGNLFLSTNFVKEFREITSIFFVDIDLIILELGYVGSLAAMLCEENERPNYSI